MTITAAWVRPALRRGARWSVAAALVLPSGVAHAAATVVDVGPEVDPVALTQTHWYAVNEAGQLAGAVPGAAPNTARAARWDKGVVTVLGSENTGGSAIADDGTVLGAVLVPHVADYPAWWDGTGEHTVQDARFANGGGGGGFVDVSHNGTAAVHVRAAVDPVDGHYIGGYVANTPFSALSTSAQPIQNADGVTAVNNFGHGLTRQKIYRGGVNYSAPLFYDGATTTQVTVDANGHHALNDFDTFVGQYGTGTGVGLGQPGEQTGAAGAVVPLPLPAGAAYARPLAINNAGLVVGTSSTAAGVPSAVIWQPGGSSVATLDSLLPPGSPWHLTSASDISDSGFILGIGTINGGPDHTFLIRGTVNALKVSLQPNTVGDDVFDLKLTTSNTGAATDPAITSLAFPAGNGLTRNDAYANGNPVAGLLPLSGPMPAFPSSLTPGQTTTHILPYAVTSPGLTQLRTQVTGDGGESGPQSDVAAVNVAASYKVPSRQDLDGLVAGGLIKLLDQAAPARDAASAQLSNAIRSKLVKGRLSAGQLAPNAFERAAAQSVGLPDNALAWLPDRLKGTGKGADYKPSRTEVLAAFLQATGSEMTHVGGDAVIRLAVVPFQYWSSFLFEPHEGDRARMAMELANLGKDTLTATGGYLATAGRFYTSPAAMQDAWEQMPRIEAEASAALHQLDVAASAAILRWDDLMRTDPIKAAKEFGKLLGRIEGEVAVGWLEIAVGTKATSALKTFVAARTAAGITEASTEVAGTTEVLVNAEKTVGPLAATPLAATPELGNLSPKAVARINKIIEDVNAKFGIKAELQARPINADAAAVKGGLGKLETIPTKNLNRDDLILGAPERYLAQTAYYKPVLPSNLSKLAAPLRERLELRAAEKLEEFKQFTGKLADPTGKTQKVLDALEPGGTKVKLGTNGSAFIELVKDVDAETGAIRIQYKKLVVNGRAVFTGKPHPIISDVDFNALIDTATGAALPAGIRGQAELEVMYQLRKAAEEGLFPFGYHGWTHSGFDVASKDFRYILKYLLMYTSEADAERVALRFAKIYGVQPSEFLKGYTKGKLVVKITATDATLGAGATLP